MLNFLRDVPLFSGMTDEALTAMLNAVQAHRQGYEKEAALLTAGEQATALGVVLQGAVRIEHEDFWGGRRILDRLEPGAVFAESYACLREEPLLVSVRAAEACEILWLNGQRLMAGGYPDSGVVCQRLLRLTAAKNLRLSRRIFLLERHRIRDRVTDYLWEEAARQGSRTIELPFNRQQLADYLSVDRSALSATLGRLRDEGLISFHRRRFTLHVGNRPEEDL